MATIARLESLELKTALTREPWRLPADTLVLPANPDGAPDEEDALVQSFARFLGPYWPRINAATAPSKQLESGFDFEKPYFVELDQFPPLLALTLKNLILATTHSPNGRQPRRAARAALELAARSGVLPLALAFQPRRCLIVKLPLSD